VAITRSARDNFWRDENGIVWPYRFINMTTSTYHIWQNPYTKRFWDEYGHEWGFADSSQSVDDKTRLGVGLISIPDEWGMNYAAIGHDYILQSPAWQASNPLSESTGILDEHLEIVAGKNPLKRVLGKALTGIAAVFSQAFWENRRTRWK